MKAAAFDYVRPSTLDEACRYLADDGVETRIIAGGQSLIPMMAMRLVRPELLVDINDIDDLSGISHVDDALFVGAGTRQATAEHSADVRDHVPLLAKALKFVGHDQIRNRGTIGGSLAHADPSAEIALAAVTLDATIALTGTGGTRQVAAGDFFLGAMTTAAEPEECLTRVSFPIWNSGHRVGAGFQEVSSRDSDFAIVAAAAQLALDADGVCRRAAVAIANAAPTPVRATRIEEALIGVQPTPALIEPLMAQMEDLLDPDGDLHASAKGRRRIAKSLTARAILEAAETAMSEASASA